MAFPVKWYSARMQGAPALTNSNTSLGELITLLKAVLVTGFGATVVSSIAYNAAAQTITLTVALNHKFLQHSVIAVSGANESGFNGEFRVKSVTSTTIVVGLDNGTPSSSSATGTLSVNYPSLGWAIEFEDATNKLIIFKRTDPLATPLRLRIDNSAWTNYNANYGMLAKFQMIEDVTDINTYTMVLDRRIAATRYYNTGTDDWALVGDSRLFYYLPKYANDQRRCLYAFGDINSIRAADNYHCLMVSYNRPAYNDTASYSWAGNSYQYYNDGLCFQNSNHKNLARSYHQIFGAVSCYWWGYRTYMGEGLTFPNPADNGYYLSVDKIPVIDDKGLRGYLPGLAVPYQIVTAYDMSVVDNLPNLPSAKILHVLCSRDTGSSGTGMVGFDIVGPWR